MTCYTTTALTEFTRVRTMVNEGLRAGLETAGPSSGELALAAGRLSRLGTAAVALSTSDGLLGSDLLGRLTTSLEDLKTAARSGTITHAHLDAVGEPVDEAVAALEHRAATPQAPHAHVHGAETQTLVGAVQRQLHQGAP